MSLTAAGHSFPEVLLWGGLISGSIDLLAACAFAATRSLTPRRVLQAIASALIGPKAFESGVRTAALGFGLHFLIAFSATAAYILASRSLPMLAEHPLVSGLLYGAAVHFFMTFVVFPLSSLKRPFSMTFFLGQLVIHMLCVGLPISLVVKHFSQAV